MITKADLLLAGWHSIYEDGKETWVHPDFDHRVPLRVARAVQKQENEKIKAAAIF